MEMNTKAKKQLPIGKSNFREFFSEDAPCYFVDKTPYIKKLVENGLFVIPINQILRPRHFGRTLILSMLQNFFDKDAPADMRPAFAKLAIGQDKTFCEKYENKYPVISITFKDVKGRTKESMLKRMNDALSGECLRHRYVEDVLRSHDSELFEKFCEGKADWNDFKQYLAFLENALYQKTKIRPLVLVDAYDVPLYEANKNGFFKDVASIISGMFSAGLKDNRDLGGSILLSCLGMAQGEINSAFYSVTDCVYAENIGFSEEETMEVLRYYGLDNRMDDVRANYGGYHIGNCSLYNPDSVMRFVNDALTDPNVPCRDYQTDTALLRELFASCATGKYWGLRPTIEKLLCGDDVPDVRVDKNIDYSTMLDCNDAVLSTLLFSGYLTVVKEQDAGSYTVRIPNKEVLSCFRSIVTAYNDKQAKKKSPSIIKALLDGNLCKTEECVNNLLNSIVVPQDKDIRGDATPCFLAGILATASIAGWNLLREKGHADFAIINEKKQAIIIDEKLTDDYREMDKLFDEGARQMETNAYAEKYEKLHYTLYKYVVVYLDMWAVIKKV